ncbi:hypothetical protein [Massilia sp. NR 4-1]|uniref:hypothetical protein n=1 Tax=Massilia sp. NR 4-1 TaxID=1678028 RepID=UPI00067E3BAA|nr:hypothetical protein [Massilia sp. NR 4-1]AKU21753.1 hypothetical protein ACZ75_10020 [Massilia sp. NR 4-1]
MKKKIALGVLMAGVMLGAWAAEERFYQIHISQNEGPSYCGQVWPGSQFNGVRQGSGPYYYIACIKY